MMEFYSAIKRNILLTYKTTWMNIRNIIMTERSQKQMSTYCMIPYIYDVLEQVKLINDERNCNGDFLCVGRVGLTVKGCEKSFWDDENVLYHDRAVVITFALIKTHHLHADFYPCILLYVIL